MGHACLDLPHSAPGAPGTSLDLPSPTCHRRVKVTLTLQVWGEVIFVELLEQWLIVTGAKYKGL